MKKVFSLIVSFVLCILCYPAMIVESAVIEPKLVHTECWTTSYYIDDDYEHPYPYALCQSRIYSDGRLYVEVQNRHEFDSFRVVEHMISFEECCPVCIESQLDKHFMWYGAGYDDWRTGLPENYQLSFNHMVLDGFGVERQDVYSIYNFYPRQYEPRVYPIDYENSWIYLNYTEAGNARNKDYLTSIVCYKDYLCDINDGLVLYSGWFIPTEEPNNTYRFRLFGHDIVISPEMLNKDTPGISETNIKTNDELESQIEELNKTISYKDTQINTLNETITALESQVEYWKKHCGDTDNDGRISISDSIILNRYLAGTVDSLPCSDPPPLAPEDEGDD